jgi:uncharacterized membrane protein (UPF0127 family)
MRLLVLAGLGAYLALAAASCRRVEEPTTRTVSTAQSPPPRNDAPAPGGPKRSGTERCVVALPEEAPSPASPAAECPKEEGTPPTFAKGAVRFPEAPSAPKLTVELAQAQEQRTHGLMYRTGMAEDRGMLFSWPDEQPQSFWMHNTCIPLDMLFIARDGTIAGILEQVPTLNDRGRTVPCPVMHVLEVNAGWTRKHGVRPGQKIALEIPN